MTSLIRARPAALAFLAFSVLLDSLAQSTSFPILPRLAQHLVDGNAAQASRWVGWLEVGWALPQFLAAPALGLLSDRIGRRPVIVTGMLGLAVELTLNALAPNVWWLLAGRVLCGVTCGAQAAAMAYVADITPPQARTGAYGWMGAATWTGIVVGPAAGGLLAAEFGLRAPFWAAGLVAVAASLWGVFALPASPRAVRGGSVEWRRASPFGSARILVDRRSLRGPSAALLLCWLAFQGKDNMLVLYATHRYGWDALAFGVFAAGLAGAAVAVQGGLAARAAQWLGERRTVLAGLALQALGMAGMGLAPSGAWFVAANGVSALGGVAMPAIQALMTNATNPSEQGALQGALSQLGSFASIAAPVAFTQLFAWTISGGRGPAWSGATILIAAAFTLGAAGLTALSPGSGKVANLDG